MRPIYLEASTKKSIFHVFVRKTLALPVELNIKNNTKTPTQITLLHTKFRVDDDLCIIQFQRQFSNRFHCRAHARFYNVSSKKLFAKLVHATKYFDCAINL